MFYVDDILPLFSLAETPCERNAQIEAFMPTHNNVKELQAKRSFAKLVSEDLREFYYGARAYTCDEKQNKIKLKYNQRAPTNKRQHSPAKYETDNDNNTIIVRTTKIKKKHMIDRKSRKEHTPLEKDPDRDYDCPCCDTTSESESEEEYLYPKERGVEGMISVVAQECQLRNCNSRESELCEEYTRALYAQLSQKASSAPLIRITGIEHSPGEDGAGNCQQIKKRAFLKEQGIEYNGQDKGIIIYRVKNQRHIKLVDILYQLYTFYMIEDFRQIYELHYEGLQPYNTNANSDRHYSDVQVMIGTFTCVFSDGAYDALQ